MNFTPWGRNETMYQDEAWDEYWERVERNQKKKKVINNVT